MCLQSLVFSLKSGYALWGVGSRWGRWGVGNGVGLAEWRSGCFEILGVGKRWLKPPPVRDTGISGLRPQHSESLTEARIYEQKIFHPKTNLLRNTSEMACVYWNDICQQKDYQSHYISQHYLIIAELFSTFVSAMNKSAFSIVAAIHFVLYLWMVFLHCFSYLIKIFKLILQGMFSAAQN